VHNPPELDAGHFGTNFAVLLLVLFASETSDCLPFETQIWSVEGQREVG
jgi:hypothetical protein